MTHTHHDTRRYVWIWGTLVALLLLGMLVFELHVARAVALLLIFSIAVVKATLVLRNYMHLHRVPAALYAVVAVPLLLAVVLALTLLPDIGFR